MMMIDRWIEINTKYIFPLHSIRIYALRNHVVSQKCFSGFSEITLPSERTLLYNVLPTALLPLSFKTPAGKNAPRSPES